MAKPEMRIVVEGSVSVPAVRPGDKLLFVFPGTASDRQLAEFKDSAGPIFPGVEIVVASGPSHVVHFPSEGDPE